VYDRMRSALERSTRMDRDDEQYLTRI